MNIKNITTYEGIKLGHYIEQNVYLIVTKESTIKFDSYSDAAKAFGLFRDLNKPSVMTRITRTIRGRKAA